MLLFQTQPYTLKSNEGQQFRLFEMLVSLKASSKQTGGAFNLFEVTCPPGFTTPLHIHYAEDVVIYVLEGALTFFCGNEEKEALPGAFFFQPLGTPHGFRVIGANPARLIYLTVPGGLDECIMEMALSGKGCDPEKAAAKYHIEILGPLPE